MQLVKNYLINFLNRSGSYVFSATVISRSLSFLASWIALLLIPKKELGVVLYAYNIITFLIPITGLGLHQSLIRYGALLKNNEEKSQLFSYVFKKGIISCFLLILIIISIFYFLEFKFNNTYYYLIIFSTLVIPSFLLEIIKAQLRLHHKNKTFAYSEIVQSITLLVLVFSLSYFFKEIGYILALIISPTITSLLFLRKINFKLNSNYKLPIKTDISFWKYGFFASLSNVVTQLLFVIDILLIGYLLNDSNLVTDYRYISLIPFSLLFLPRVFINTDFVLFTEKIYDTNYIKTYIKSYLILFTLISLIMCFITFLLSDYILYFFGENFIKYTDIFIILIVGISGVFILRGLFGNLLSSIGKAKVNYYISIIALILNISFNYFLIPEYGIKGAAITTAVLMWITGLASAFIFWMLYQKDFSKTP